MDQIPHMVKNHIILVLMLLFHRENLRVMNMFIILQIIMFISPRRISLLIHTSTLTPSCETKCTCFNATFLIWSVQNDELFTTPRDVGGEEIELISYAGSGLQTNLNV